MNTAVVTIRKPHLADAGAIADVHIASWRTTYAGIVAQSYLDALSVDERTAAWTRWLSASSPSRSEIRVAETHSHLVGFVAGGLRREVTGDYHAQLYAIYLRSEGSESAPGASWH